MSFKINYDVQEFKRLVADGCTKPTISEWRKEHGLPRNNTCTVMLNPANAQALTIDRMSKNKSREPTVNLTNLLGIPERKPRPKPEIKLMAREPEIVGKEEIVGKGAIQKLNDTIQKLDNSLQKLNSNIQKLNHNLQKADACKLKVSTMT